VGILSTNLTNADTPTGVWPVAVGDVLFFFSVVRTSIETSTPEGIEQALENDYASALSAAASLWGSHVKAWQEDGGLWAAGYEIEGRPDVAAAANASLAAILASIRSDRPFGISPSGITSGWYYGHVFWDQELWMLPPLTLTHPNLAASLLSYRLAHLPQAQAKAVQYGWQGAFYPWQSGSSGVETCPSYASYGIVREIHLNGDIAMAAKGLWESSGDLEWMNSTAWPLFTEVARFFMSRLLHDNPGAFNSSSNTSFLHILNVCGPDEEHDGVNDSVFTNAVASLSLQSAAMAGEALGASPDLYTPWAVSFFPCAGLESFFFFSHNPPCSFTQWSKGEGLHFSILTLHTHTHILYSGRGPSSSPAAE